MKVTARGLYFAVLFRVCFASLGVYSQGTAFTYQGNLAASGTNAIGTFDFQFAVYDSPSGGDLLGGPQAVTGLPVTNGYFMTPVDFGSNIFNGVSCWLEIGVRTNGGSDSFFILSPRQLITAAPYAMTAGTLSGPIPQSLVQAALAGTTISIANGGTGANTPQQALSALGGVSSAGYDIFTGNDYFYGTTHLGGAIYGPYGPGCTLFTQGTTDTSADASLLISSSPWTSGSFFTTTMTMTNEYGDPNPYGYYNWDLQAMSIGSVGLQAIEGNYPGVNLLVGNGEPMIFAFAGGGAGNMPYLAVESGAEWTGSQHVIVHFPFSGDGTRHRPFNTIYTFEGKVYASYPNDGEEDTLQINEDFGIATLCAGRTLMLSNAVLNSTAGQIVGSDGYLNPSMLDAGQFTTRGSTSNPVNIYTANHLATANDSTMLINAAGVAITLPDATHFNGCKYTVKVIDAAPSTVATTNGQTIDGTSSYTLLGQYKYVTVQSAGGEWLVIANN